MLYTPSGIATADLDIAQAPFFGGEFALYASPVAAVLIGEIIMTAAAAGAFTDNPATALPGTPGTDLQLVSIEQLDASVATVVNISGTGVTNATLAGAATFTPASRLDNQSFNFNAGTAVDVVTAASEKYRTGAITLASITGGGRGARFRLYQLPAASDWTLIGCTGDLNVTPKTRRGKSIQCGMDESAFTKRGAKQAGTLSVKGKLRSFADGLKRLDGARVSLMAVGLKEGLVITDRMVLTGVVLSVKDNLPDAEGEAVSEAEGMYADSLYFTAP